MTIDRFTLFRIMCVYLLLASLLPLDASTVRFQLLAEMWYELRAFCLTSPFELVISDPDHTRHDQALQETMEERYYARVHKCLNLYPEARIKQALSLTSMTILSLTSNGIDFFGSPGTPFTTASCKRFYMLPNITASVHFWFLYFH
ncbi:hypothetical protein C8R43DRAFT_941974 [Mycena crocata]|nr:hypothetical protein C8R43DRAFT_941974 [Mycena crocata]